jgi:phospholipid transport system substrate-binding protein
MMHRISCDRRALLALGFGMALFGGSAARAAPGGDASAPIRALNEGLLAIMRAGKATSFTQRFDMLAPVIDRTFDLPALLRGAVGLGWASLSQPDQEALREAFRRFSIASWVANFDDFQGQRFTVKPEPRAIGDGGLVVETEFAAPGAEPVTLSYVMRLVGDEWRAVDVLAQGTISRVAVLRSDFRRALAQGGAPALLAQLRQKVAALAGG